jgi:hypothetical protein
MAVLGLEGRCSIQLSYGRSRVYYARFIKKGKLEGASVSSVIRNIRQRMKSSWPNSRTHLSTLSEHDE